ncbi:DivIVA domain-containing protein [Micromonospora siamensis]|uniref:DivIVA domain-containing protein n=1 Tax=Micromonospora siamensis TaxID=299152 RepID=A0A1C5HNP9_9ACTN|nr:DivIVA domain-containing protein [Micromonospora siamensis]SCG47547.1 DivIVA domain-containing protein [Micromonospora siamensis]
MASQGQRFRRKALRRGYKVDEVDAFLDRVEATLAGQPVGAPVASQEVHDVVFRVRFNGYDEWQVDLHLDRVERQLAELEERGGLAGRGADPRKMDRLGPPMRDDRGLSPVPQPLPPRAMPAQAGPPADRYGRYDEPTGAFAGGYDAPRGGYDGPRGPGPMGPGPQVGHGAPPPHRGLPSGPGGFGPEEQSHRGLPPGPGGFGQDEQSHRGLPPGPGGFGQDDQSHRGLPPGPGGFGQDEQRFDGFEAGRHGRADMTAEIRMNDRELRDMRGRGPGGPPSLPQQAGGPPSMAAPQHGGPPMGGPPMVGPPMAGPPGSDLYRVDQIRRRFQVRRFGSGYDPDQVDRFFESLLGGMQGRNPMPVNPKDLDTLRFGLVPGGYFEAEVDAALKDVQDILFGR